MLETDEPVLVENNTTATNNTQHRNVTTRRWRLCTLLNCKCDCKNDKTPNEIPIYHSSLCSLINYTWLTPFIWRTYRKGHVDSTDIWPYPSADSCDTVLPKWEWCVEVEVQRQHIERLSTTSNASQFPQIEVTPPPPPFKPQDQQNHVRALSSTSSFPPLSPNSSTPEKTTGEAGKKESTLNLVWAVLRFQLVTLFSVLFLRLATLAVVLLSSIFGLRTIIREVENDSMDLLIGVTALLGMVFLLLCKSVLWSQAFCVGGIAGVRLRGAVLFLCLHKLLKSKSLLSIRPTITNIFANDSKTFLDLSTHLTTLFSAFAMVLAVSVCGFFIIGPWSLMATAVFLIYIPVEFYISSIIMRIRRRTQHLADQRLDIMRELLSSIRLIKFLALETFFYQRILEIWRQEVKYLRKNWILSSLSVSFVFTVPLLASVSTFLPHILLGNRLDVAQAFVFVGMWAAARQFVHMIPMSMKGLNDARVAAYRLSRVFYLPQLSPPTNVIDVGENGPPLVVEMKDLTAAYPRAPKGLRKPRRDPKQRRSRKHSSMANNNSNEGHNNNSDNNNTTNGIDASPVVNNNSLLLTTPSNIAVATDSDTASDHMTGSSDRRLNVSELPSVLKNVNFSVRRGQFIGVCGHIGSGKSTLLNAILGRLDVVAGSIAIAKNTKTAIVIQDAWLFNGSIRENILFGKSFDSERYFEIIQNCELMLDLDLMEHGDATEITEYGANLSGGQRQRLSLARALYAQADLLLLDDPLSAIDIALSRQIFDDALLPLKGASTVVFVSHRLEFLMKCDLIFVMRDGTVTEFGKHAELMSKPGGEYLSLVQSFYRQRKQQAIEEPFDVPEEEEEAFELDRITSLVTQAAAGLVLEDHPLDVSLTITPRQPGDFTNHDSLTAAVGAKVFLTKTPRKYKTSTGSAVLSESGEKNGFAKVRKGDQDGSVKETSGPSNGNEPTKLLVAESLFRSRVDVSANPDAAKRGHLAFSVYMTYANAAGRPILLIAVLLGYILTHGLVAFTKYWLAYWLKQGGARFNQSSVIFPANDSSLSFNDENNVTVVWSESSSADLSTNPLIKFYAIVYVSSTVGVLIAAVIKSCLVAMFALRASNNMHKQLLSRLLSCPLSFFESTKSGTIISRFAKDIDELTSKLPASLEFLLSNMSVLITSCIAISVVLPWFLVCCLVLIVVCSFIFRLAQVALRDLRRVEAYSLQPLLSLLASVVAGAPVIAAFDRTQMFLNRASALIDRTSAVMLLLQFSGRWLSWRLDLLVNGTILVAGTLVLALRDHLAPAFAGLVLSMIIEMAGILQVATRMFLNTESSFVSVERISSFQNRLPTENVGENGPEPKPNKKKSLTVEVIANETDNNLLLPKFEVPPDWPSLGAISFELVSLSYTDTSQGSNNNLALDDVSFDIKPREFVAVIGRSGSGKSSIAAVVTRLYMINRGRIVIDGVDIANVPLRTLRKCISVVPQDPFLFSGTIRSNLDPYNEHTDEELWAALDRCALKWKIQDRARCYYQSADSLAGGGSDVYVGSSDSRLAHPPPSFFQSFTGNSKQANPPPAALLMPLSSNDVHFSTGERQLLCLARALVRNSAILILDEATASIDAETENRIQTTLNIEAHRRTIITIVHRVETVISPTSRCDRVMVMDAGRVVEICDIATMQQRSADASHFSRMAHVAKDI